MEPPGPKRRLRRPVGTRSCEEQLGDVERAVLEATPRSGHVKPPGSVDLLAGERAGPLGRGFEALDPGLQGERVVRTERLDVDQLEPGTPRERDRVLDRRQLPIGEDVAPDEASVAKAKPARAVTAADSGGRDPVVQEEAAGPESTERSGEVLAELFAPNVLEHAHRRDRVELTKAGEVAIVLDDTRARVPRPCFRTSSVAQSAWTALRVIPVASAS